MTCNFTLQARDVLAVTGVTEAEGESQDACGHLSPQV